MTVVVKKIKNNVKKMKFVVEKNKIYAKMMMIVVNNSMIK